eukprot:scaffold14684_cov93-Cylindrotheca_fusiformis.AAC.1
MVTIETATSWRLQRLKRTLTNCGNETWSRRKNGYAESPESLLTTCDGEHIESTVLPPGRNLHEDHLVDGVNAISSGDGANTSRITGSTPAVIRQINVKTRSIRAGPTTPGIHRTTQNMTSIGIATTIEGRRKTTCETQLTRIEKGDSCGAEEAEAEKAMSGFCGTKGDAAGRDRFRCESLLSLRD